MSHNEPTAQYILKKKIMQYLKPKKKSFIVFGYYQEENKKSNIITTI